MTIRREQNTAATNVDALARAFLATTVVDKTFVADLYFNRESRPYSAIDVIYWE